MLMSLADPRWRFVLHMNWRAQTIPFLLNGPSSDAPPTKSQIFSISPYAQILVGTYRTPTFLIHGRPDDLIPWQQSMRTIEALKARGVEADIEIVEGARHLFDTFPEIGVDFEPSVRRGYSWLGRFV
jgi:acetyl esterase/lipase